jgi:glycosyltransferase 2 family protein
MGKKIISYLQYMVFIAAGFLLVWWQIHSMTDEQLTKFKAAISNANFLLIIPVVAMSLLSHLSRGMRWKILMEPLGYKPKTKNVFSVIMIGYLVNSFVPRVGEIIKCSLLAKYENLKTDKLIGTIIIERTIDLITYGFFLIITVLIQIDVVSNYVSEKFSALTKNSDAGTWIKLAAIIAFIFIIYFIIKKLSEKYPNNKILVKVRNFTKGIVQGFISVKNLKDRKGFLLHSIFIWAMYLLQIYIGFKAMDATMGLGIKAACAVLSLSTLAMIATPGGMGSFPLFVMQTLLIYGIAEAEGFAFGWVIWGVSTINIIIVGVICLIALLKTKPVKDESIATNTE